MESDFDTELWSKIFTTEPKSSGTVKSVLNFRKKFWNFWFGYDWIFVTFLFLLTFFLGYWGFLNDFEENGITFTIWDILYRILQLFVLATDNSTTLPWQLEAARLLAPIALSYTGSRVIVLVFQQGFRLFQLKFYKNHVIICGLNQEGIQLVKDFCMDGIKVVALESDDLNDNILVAREEDAIVLIGSLTDKNLLHKARIETAKYLIAISNDDSTNIETAASAFTIKSQKPKNGLLSCFVKVSDLKLNAGLKSYKFFNEKYPFFSARIFNSSENAARLLFHKYPLEMFGDTNSLESPPLHIVIIGFNTMGENILTQATKLAVFANQKKLNATIIDKDAIKKKELFLYRYPQFHKVCDTYWEQGDVEDVNLYTGKHWEKENRPPITQIFICSKDDSSVFSCAISLSAYTKENSVPIFIHLRSKIGIASLLNPSPQNPNRESIIPFGMVEEICTRELVALDTMSIFARYTHERYLDIRRREGHQMYSRPAMYPWNELNESLRDSNLQQTDHIPVKLRTVGFNIQKAPKNTNNIFKFTEEELQLLARIEHNRWMTDRYLAGYEYADIDGTDHTTKKSKFLVPFDRLDEKIKKNDEQVVLNIPHLLAILGLEIFRN